MWERLFGRGNGQRGKGPRRKLGRPARGPRRLSGPEALEPRAMLSAVVLDGASARRLAAPLVAEPSGSAAPSRWEFTPQEIGTAYGIDSIGWGSLVGNGSGQTIAIVTAYDDPDLTDSTNAGFATSDLHKFDVQFNLPDPPSFLKIDQQGGTNYPASSTDWSGETAMDVEWAHATAPAANIVLVEANSAYNNDLMFTAVNTARNLAGVSVVSMSFGESEFSGELTLDPIFTTPAGHTGVTFVAASGDDGPPGHYPGCSPNVVSVGGSSLSIASDNSYAGETEWPSSGGGESAYESRPAYQNGVQSSAMRETPDVALHADTARGAAVCDSFGDGSATPWTSIAGTSFSTPVWAGLIAIADQLRAAQALAPLDGPTQTLPGLYALPSTDFHVLSGAGTDYDTVTGRGSPVANALVPDLAIVDTQHPLTVPALPAEILGGTVNVGTTQVTVEFNSTPVGTSVSNRLHPARRRARRRPGHVR